MASITQFILLSTLIGIGATAVMDAWLMFLKRCGVQTLSMAFIGRWVGHLARGQVRHAPIARAEPVPGELALGWLMHYLTGVVFAALLLAIEGIAWGRSPTLLPAFAVGLATVAVPLLLIQPAMGAGLLARKTPTPRANCLRSLANHGVFGLGLYLAALPCAWLLS